MPFFSPCDSLLVTTTVYHSVSENTREKLTNVLEEYILIHKHKKSAATFAYRTAD